MKVRDKLWLFASHAHDDDIWFARSPGRRIGSWSRITPTEGAMMLGLDNVIMVSSDGTPVPFSSDANGYMESFCNMKNVWWSVSGALGFRAGNEEDYVLELSKKHPNLKGAYFDEPLKIGKDFEQCKKIIHDVGETLKKSDSSMEIWATCFADDAKSCPDAGIYDPLDGIVLWNPHIEAIGDMEKHLEVYEKLLPDKKKMMGIYMFHYKKREPISDELMEFQCLKALQWLKEGRIEGIVFHTNSVMGVGFSCEYWLRNWIDEVGKLEV